MTVCSAFIPFVLIGLSYVSLFRKGGGNQVVLFAKEEFLRVTSQVYGKAGQGRGLGTQAVRQL